MSTGRVLNDAGTLNDFASDHSFTPKMKPHTVVKPSKDKQINKLVKLTNEDGLTLIPVSSRPPRFRGDTVPARDGGRERKEGPGQRSRPSNRIQTHQEGNYHEP